MNKIPRLYCPGPVYVPERVRQAMALPIPHHRSGQFKELMHATRGQLRRVWQTPPDWEPLLFPCSGTGAMEGAVVNFMKRGAKAINVSAGKFGERWARILEAYGCEPIELKLEWGRSVTVDQVVDVVRANPDVRAIFLTSADTSTGVEHPVRQLGPAIRKLTDALIIVDCICDLGGGCDIRPAEWEIDVAVSCSQKCLMLPPGLGLATVSPRAWGYVSSGDLPRFYFDWQKERDRETEGLTAYTSAVNLIRGLHESLCMIEEEGLSEVLNRHARNAAAVRAAVTALELQIFAERPTNGVTAVRAPDGIPSTKLIEHLTETYGYRIANGQDHLKGEIFRIGHMGSVAGPGILSLLHVIDRSLADLGYDRAGKSTCVSAAEASLLSETGAP